MLLYLHLPAEIRVAAEAARLSFGNCLDTWYGVELQRPGLRGQRWDPVGIEGSRGWVPASKRVPLTRLGLGLNFKWSKKPEVSRMVTGKQVPGQPSREV